jgi:23S rRNA pseudouridine1911/1915/1917 synthase
MYTPARADGTTISTAGLLRAENRANRPRVTRLRASSVDLVRPVDVDAESVVSVFRVPPEVAGQRADVFLQSQLKRTSRTRAAVILAASGYDALGKRVKAGDRVRAEQHIVLWRAPWDETPVPTDIPVIYEDEHLFAVNKPAHLPVHPTARYFKNTLIKLLQAERPDSFVSLGHRLDRETSGVLMVSKTPECDRALKRVLELRSDIDKTYLAFSWGLPAEQDATFRCDLPLELDTDSPLKVKMRIGKTADALSAGTRFRVLDTKRRGSRTYAKVLCDLETGRQHQIRVHLASFGTPIVGDKLYGPDERMFARAADGELTEDDLVALEHPRHALHAFRVGLAHPITGRPLLLEAPLPDDLESFWSGLEPMTKGRRPSSKRPELRDR